MGSYHIDIGKQLKARRLEQKREIKDIAKDTKVSESYLEAIEAGLIDEFPSSVYYNLFARSYARELGFDPEQLFGPTLTENADAEKAESLQGGEPVEEPSARETKEGSSLAKVGLWVAGIVIVIFVVILIIFNAGQDSDRQTMIEESRLDSPVEQQAIDESQTIVTEEPGALQSEIEQQTPAQSAPRQQTSVQPEPKMKLRIDANELSWVLVMADGDTVLNRNLDSGSYRTVEADYQFVISTGNPSGINMKLNDTLLKSISSGGRPIRNVEINRLNKDQFFDLKIPEAKDTGIGEH